MLERVLARCLSSHTSWTTDGGGTWSLLSFGEAGQPGVIACAAALCYLAGAGPFAFPAVGQFATSTDGGVTWATDDTPSTELQIFGMVPTPSGWIAVGESRLNGPQIVTSP